MRQGSLGMVCVMEDQSSFRYPYGKKLGFRVFTEILQKVGEWFPIHSVRVSPDNLYGEITLVRQQGDVGHEKIARLRFTIVPAKEGIDVPSEERPFLSISAGEGMYLRFNSLRELNERFLGCREEFMDVMAKRKLPFSIPSEEPSTASGVATHQEQERRREPKASHQRTGNSR